MAESESPRRIPQGEGEPPTGPALKACKSLKRNRVADDGIQTSSSSDAKHVAISAEVPELLSNQNTILSSNTRMSSAATHTNSHTLCRLTRCNNTATKGRKRSHSSLALPTSTLLKRSKPSSSTESSIAHLPDFLLVEILSRVPCYKFIFQCKSVSKRWCTLISDPYFIRRFSNIQSSKETPKIRTLITEWGEEFPPKTSSTPNLLTPMLKQIKTSHSLRAEPRVVAMCNDLVLCNAYDDDPRDYYICSPYTMQWVALPPAPTQCEYSPLVGLICDTPSCNADCRCMVVRVLSPGDEEDENEIGGSFTLNMEIFSSETGHWRQTVVSSPHFFFCAIKKICFPYNGMLYWFSHEDLLILGFGPFRFNSNKSSSISTSSSSSSYSDGRIDDELRLTVFEEPRGKDVAIECVDWYEGCVRMSQFCQDSRSLHVWEFKEEDHDEMRVNGAAGKLCLTKHNVYPLDPNIIPDDPGYCELRTFDPNNKDIFYLLVNDFDLVKCNIHTREWSVEKFGVGGAYYFPHVPPWWPTPVPRLPPPMTDETSS